MSEQLQFLDFLVKGSITDFDYISDSPAVAAGVRQVSNAMHTSAEAATKTPKLSYALEGMTERQMEMVGASDADQDGVVTQAEATNKQYDRCEIDFLEADQASGNIDKMLSMSEAAHMFKKLHDMELSSAFTMVYIRDGSDGSVKDDKLTMSELCKPLEQIVDTGTRGSGSGSGSGAFRERLKRALRPMYALIEDHREMKRERRALMVAKQHRKETDGDERRLQVLNEALNTKNFNRFAYSVLKQYTKHAKKQRRLKSSRRLQEKYPELVEATATAGVARRAQGYGYGYGYGMDYPDMGKCKDLSAEDLGSLDPPAPGTSCPEIMADPRLAGVSCSDDLAGPFGDDAYMGATLCGICCNTCGEMGMPCMEPPMDLDYEGMFYDPFEEEAGDYVTQYLATELLEAGILAEMEYEEFLAVVMLLAMDCAPMDQECEAVSEFLGILGHAVKDPEVSDEFGALNISTSDKPSPFVTCKKEQVEEYTTDGRRLRAVPRAPSNGRRLAQTETLEGIPCNDIWTNCQGCESSGDYCGLPSQGIVCGLAACPTMSAMKQGHYCDYTGPDENPCCSLQSREAQNDCLGDMKGEDIPGMGAPWMGYGSGSGSGSGSGMPLPPDMLISADDAIAGCESLTGASNIGCMQNKKDIDDKIIAQAGMVECPDPWTVVTTSDPAYFPEVYWPYYAEMVESGGMSYYAYMPDTGYNYYAGVEMGYIDGNAFYVDPVTGDPMYTGGSYPYFPYIYDASMYDQPRKLTHSYSYSGTPAEQTDAGLVEMYPEFYGYYYGGATGDYMYYVPTEYFVDDDSYLNTELIYAMDLPSHCIAAWEEWYLSAYAPWYYYDFGWDCWNDFSKCDWANWDTGASYSSYRRKLAAMPKKRKVSNHARPGLKHR
jgi:hypothetical protein